MHTTSEQRFSLFLGITWKKLGAELQSVFKNKQIANVKASAILQAQGNVFYKEENNIQI